MEFMLSEDEIVQQEHIRLKRLVDEMKYTRNDFFERLIQIETDNISASSAGGHFTVVPYPLFSGNRGRSTAITMPWLTTIPTLQTYFDTFAYVMWDEIEFIIESQAQPMDYGCFAWCLLPFTPLTPGLPSYDSNASMSYYDAQSLLSYENVLWVNMSEQTQVILKTQPPALYEWFSTGAGQTNSNPPFPNLWLFALPCLYCLDPKMNGNVSITNSAYFYRINMRFKGLRFHMPLATSHVTKQTWGCSRVPPGGWMAPIAEASGYRHCGANHGEGAPTGGGEPINFLDSNCRDHDGGVDDPKRSWDEVDDAFIAANVRDFKKMGWAERGLAGVANLAIMGAKLYRNVIGTEQDGDVELNPGPPKTCPDEIENEGGQLEEHVNVNPYPSDFAMTRTGNCMRVTGVPGTEKIDGAMFGDTNFRHSMKEFISRPGFWRTWLLNTANNFFQFPIHVSTFIPSSTYEGYIPVAYMSQFFRWWRGSFKLMFYFFGNAFITARVRICLVGGNTTYTDTTIIQPLWPTKDVTVKGSVQVAVSIPYCFPSDWNPVQIASSGTNYGADGVIPTVSVTLLSIVNGAGSVTPSIPMVIYLGAGEDFEFKDPITTLSDTDTTPFVKQTEGCSAVNPREDFKRSFDQFPGYQTFMKKVKMTSQVTMIEELMQRWAVWDYNGGGIGSEYVNFQENELEPYAGTSSGVQNGNNQLLMNLFMFITGDQDFMINIRREPVDPSSGGSSPGDVVWAGFGWQRATGDYNPGVSMTAPDNGFCFTVADHWNNLRITMPMMAQIPAFPTSVLYETMGWGWNGSSYSFTPRHVSRQVGLPVAIMTYSDVPFTTLESVYYRNGPNFRMMRELPIYSARFWNNQGFIDAPDMAVLAKVMKRIKTTQSRTGPPIYMPRTQQAMFDHLIMSATRKVKSPEITGKEKDKSAKPEKELGDLSSWDQHITEQMIPYKPRNGTRPGKR